MALTWDKVTYFPNGVNQGTIILIGGAAGDHTATGIKAGDQIVKIEAVEFAAGVPSDIHGLTDEFTVSADDTLNNTGGTDTTDMLIVAVVVLAKREGAIDL